MFWHQVVIRLGRRPRGFHLVTDELLTGIPEIRRVRVGLLHLLLQHTSASLSLNENADPDVRADLERWCDHVIPERASYFVHTTEGDDDMPAHVKAAVLGSSVTLPIRGGKPALGTWQGIYLGEHRDQGAGRSVVATLWGQVDEPSGGDK